MSTLANNWTSHLKTAQDIAGKVALGAAVGTLPDVVNRWGARLVSLCPKVANFTVGVSLTTGAGITATTTLVKSLADTLFKKWVTVDSLTRTVLAEAITATVAAAAGYGIATLLGVVGAPALTTSAVVPVAIAVYKIALAVIDTVNKFRKDRNDKNIKDLNKSLEDAEGALKAAKANLAQKAKLESQLHSEEATDLTKVLETAQNNLQNLKDNPVAKPADTEDQAAYNAYAAAVKVAEQKLADAIKNHAPVNAIVIDLQKNTANQLTVDNLDLKATKGKLAVRTATFKADKGGINAQEICVLKARISALEANIKFASEIAKLEQLKAAAVK